MTYYDITIGNDIDSDTHCDIIMGHDIAMGAYHDIVMHTDLLVFSELYHVFLNPIMI